MNILRTCTRYPAACWGSIRAWFAHNWRLRYFFHRYGQLLAYLLVAAMSFYAIKIGLQNATTDRQALADSARRVVRVGCEADRDTAVALRSALKGQIKFVLRAHEPAPPTTAQRIAQLQTLIDSIQVPDCDARVSLIQDEAK